MICRAPTFCKQAKSLKDVELSTALPGIKVNTSAKNNMVWTQMRLQRWNGASWELFGDVSRRRVRVTERELLRKPAEEGAMKGLMQNQPLLLSSLLKHADRFHSGTEIVSRTVEGPDPSL